MVQEIAGQPPQAEHPKRGFRLSCKYVALILGCMAVFGVGGYLLLIKAPLAEVSGPIRVGESQIYGVYVGAAKVGTLKTWVENMTIFDGVDCYVARYSLTVGDASVAGRMLFDNCGRLRHAKIAQAENEGLKWSTEIGYSPTLGVMRAIVEDNRVPENYRAYDNTVVIPGEVMVPIHAWYLFRVENLYLGYQRNFYVNVLPIATTVVPARMMVLREEKIETAAGSFDSWKLQGENVASLWVTKDGRLVAKAVEQVGGATWTYLLESRT